MKFEDLLECYDDYLVPIFKVPDEVKNFFDLVAPYIKYRKSQEKRDGMLFVNEYLKSVYNILPSLKGFISDDPYSLEFRKILDKEKYLCMIVKVGFEGYSIELNNTQYKEPTITKDPRIAKYAIDLIQKDRDE